MNPLSAISPQHNVTVMASAGTGKTWLLVTRLIRLLMEGTSPDAILAITFTRKAAAEMQSRLMAQLFDFINLDSDSLSASLENIGIDVDTAAVLRARSLYESLLRSERKILITTFHAFCQEILRRFPLEADVPPGFEVLDTAGLFEQEAWDALFDEATNSPNGKLAQALDVLLSHCGGVNGTRMSLFDFLQHRSDWWAFTGSTDNPVDYATKILINQLNISPADNPADRLLNDDFFSLLSEFISFLEKHPTASNTADADRLQYAIGGSSAASERITAIMASFLTKAGAPKVRKETKTQASAMGDAGQQRFLALHLLISEQLLEYQELERKQATLVASTAWYYAGNRLIEHYQNIKTEQRQLDFNDLEWKAYQLLNHADNAHWIQYKIDQRIDHLLIDEFQDTNPTQWRLILPLLEELAAGDHIGKRSVFIVGDSKQSIYRFRRADPQLLFTAQKWLSNKLGAIDHPLTVSWRSAPAIIEFVNKTFMSASLIDRLPSFQTHDTHHKQLWGKVTLLPLVQYEPSTNGPLGECLRNPLITPRDDTIDLRHYHEGRLIAEQINKMITEQLVLGDATRNHIVSYDDIIILVRNKTHVHFYERALREAAIPYSGIGKNTLLDNLEIQDMVALLELLIAPYNNLALAMVLRSPVFSCSDVDLMKIAADNFDESEQHFSWFKRLSTLANNSDTSPALRRAHHWLEKWHSLAGHLPVHDLLDRIYHEGNIINRYIAAFPAHLGTRVSANLNRFIELALAVDSGRYPSLAHFINRIRKYQAFAQDVLDEPSDTQTTSVVRIMTIHAAKGLEAPIVFLADTAKRKTHGRGYRALIDWPSQSSAPECFLLAGKKSELDPWSRSLISKFEDEEAREEANLLYVALTRAKQLMFVSGCEPKSGDEQSWYRILSGLAEKDDISKDSAVVICESGCMPSPGALPESPATDSTLIVDQRLSSPIPASTESHTITPSDMSRSGITSLTTDEDGTQRGIAIHRMLDVLSSPRGESNYSGLIFSIANNLEMDPMDPVFTAWYEEASGLISNPALSELFDPQCFEKAYNEVPLQYFEGDRVVYGVIDRLVLKNGDLWLIDYKTHLGARPDNLDEIARNYYHQLGLYARGVSKIWPERKLRMALLFTACASLYELVDIV